jgi:hypothetical protein
MHFLPFYGIFHFHLLLCVFGYTIDFCFLVLARDELDNFVGMVKYLTDRFKWFFLIST